MIFRVTKLLLALLICVSLSGCISSASVKGADKSFCLLYEPVYTHPQDTEKTKVQTDRNNAIWLELCDK